MNTAADLTSVIRHLRTPGADVGDPELLDRYARGSDQAAFAALVQRYGTLVLGVARRQLADRHRAEDVFQATFLALARSAAKLGGRPVLANWLYTVALRQSRKARARDARREARDRAAQPRSEGDPLDDITAREFLRVIDEELARLPDRLRLPVLLCCVQGLSREEVAARLGVSEGTVRGRLERGRRRLAARLTARGLAPSALILAPLAAVTVPADLFARAAEQAVAPWAKSVPGAVAELAAPSRPVLAVAVLAGCVLAVGLVGWVVAAGGPNPADPTPAIPARAAAPVPAANPAPADQLPEGATAQFGTPRFRHPATIEGLAVSADGKVAVAHSGTRSNGAVRAYDLTTGRVLLDLERDTAGGGFVEGVAVSPDGRTIAVKRNFSVYLRDATTGAEIGRAEYPKANPYSTTDVLVFAPDGKHVAVAAAEGKSLHLIGLARGEVLRTFPHAHVLFAAAFSPDGKHLVAGGYDSEKNVYFARLWDAESGKELHRLPFGNGGIRCVAYSADGTTVALGGDGGKDSTVKLFEATTGKERSKITFRDAYSVKSVCFSPDGKTLAASGGSSTRLFEVATGKEVLKIDRKAIGLRFSPDGQALVGAVAGAIYRWDATTGESLIPEGGDSSIAQIELTADGKRMITRGQDGDAHVWEARTGEHVRRVDVSWQRGLALSPDGRFMVWPVADEKIQFKDENQPNVTHTGSRLRLFDLTEGKLVGRFDGFAGGADDLFFAAEGKTLVTVDRRDAAVRFWNVATGKAEQSFHAGQKAVRNHVWRSRLSPDGKVLAVTYHPTGRGIFSQRAVKLWEVPSEKPEGVATIGKELHDLAGHFNYVEALAFSPDGKYLVTGCEALGKFAQERLKLPADQVFVWEVATGKKVAQLPIGATAAAFAPDGKALAVAEQDGAIRLWDTAKWAVNGEFPGPRDRIVTLTFGSDGRLYSGSVTATVLAWDPRAAKPPAERK